MKLRYYMRGLGIGILVTAILMSVTMHGKTESLTDEQIIERARQLGMEEKYDAGVLVDAVSDNDADKQKTETAVEDESEKTQETSKNDDIEETDTVSVEADKETTRPGEAAAETEITEKTEASTDENAGSLDEIETDEDTDKKQESGSEAEAQNTENKEDAVQPEQTQTADVQITVNSGDGSQTVAQKLKDAGLIEDANEYDRYLCSGGYDKRICTGTHTIPSGASEQQIADILTTRVR